MVTCGPLAPAPNGSRHTASHPVMLHYTLYQKNDSNTRLRYQKKTQSKLGEARLGWMDQSWFNWFQARPRKYSSSSLVVARTEDFAEVSGKGFLAPGNGKGNWKSHSRFTRRERELENATGREGKFEARNPGKSRESCENASLNSRFYLFSCLDQPSAKLQIMIVFPVLIPGQNFLFPGTGREITKCHGKGNLRLVFPGVTGNGNSRSPL